MVEEKDAIKKLIGYQIGITSNLLRRVFAAQITKYAENISPEQFAVLVRLSTKNGLSQNVIAESVLKDDATITRILDSLEKKKLAVRKKAEHDRRSNLAYLTPQGKTLVEKVFPKARFLNERLLDGIEKEHIRVVFEVLERLRENAMKI
jgi:DNA-binding MarR family transcriptional regulator